MMDKLNFLVDTNLVERLRHVDSLSKEVYKSLNLSAEKHNLWAVKNMRELVILTDESILATHLRLGQDSIRRHFRQKLQVNVDAIIIKMVMPKAQPIEEPKRPSKLSPQSAKSLMMIAKGIEDEGLQEQLIRLAKQDNKVR